MSPDTVYETIQDILPFDCVLSVISRMPSGGIAIALCTFVFLNSFF